MAVLILAAALGAAGSGPLSSRTAKARGGHLAVDYERVVRRDAPTTIKLTVTAAASRDPAIWIAADYLDRVHVRSITPAPREQRLGGDRRVFVFARASAATGGTIAVELAPNTVGSLAGEAGMVGGDPVAFRQLVLP